MEVQISQVVLLIKHLLLHDQHLHFLWYLYGSEANKMWSKCRVPHSLVNSERDNMGNFWRKRITMQDRLRSVKDMSENVSSAASYDVLVNMMFADSKFNPGRVEVWYVFSQAIRDHLLVSEHESLHRYFSKGMCVLRWRLPYYVKRFHDIENEWKKTGWCFKKMNEFSDLWGTSWNLSQFCLLIGWCVSPHMEPSDWWAQVTPPPL